MIRPVAREAMNIVARRVGKERGEGERAFFNEFRHQAGDIRIQIDEALVHIAQEGQGKHGL